MILIREIITVYSEKHMKHVCCVKEKSGPLSLNMVVIPAPELPSSRTFFMALPVAFSVGKFYLLGLNVSVFIYRMGVFVQMFNHSTNT
jgi:hypothetical protein